MTENNHDNRWKLANDMVLNLPLESLQDWAVDGMVDSWEHDANVQFPGPKEAGFQEAWDAQYGGNDD